MVSHYLNAFDVAGVHVGDSVLKAKEPMEWRSAVSFHSEETKKFLRKHKLM